MSYHFNVADTINKLREIQKIHHESTKPMDAYFTGMYNGMELAIATMENSPANYKKVERVKLWGKKLKSIFRQRKLQD